jgi:hypothetical protein
MRYLAERHNVDDVWWSRELKKQARMNSALDWALWVLRKTGKDLLASYELGRASLVDEYWGTNAGAPFPRLPPCPPASATRPGPGRAHAGKPNGLFSAIARLEALWLTKREYAAGRQRLTIVDLVLWADFSYLFGVFHLDEHVTADKYPKLVRPLPPPGALCILIISPQFAWQERVKAALSGLDAYAAWTAHVALRGEPIPRPPPCPPNLDLPWKDYK